MGHGQAMSYFAERKLIVDWSDTRTLSSSAPQARGDLPITETIDEVIVYHSNRLHVRINDRGADEAESPAFEVLTECDGFGRSRWHLPRNLPVVHLGPADDETPAIGVKVSELF